MAMLTGQGNWSNRGRTSGHFAPWVILSTVCLVLSTASIVVGQEQATDADCLVCHEVNLNEQEKPYDSLLANSAHQDLGCLDCHSSIVELPHAESLPPVECGQCHTDDAETYQWHGRLRVGEGQDIPSCADCHGKHDILPADDKHSRVNPQNLPKTCGNCHEDINLTTKHEILYEKAVEVYESSVHGQASLGGVYLAATCNDCHSAGGSAHRILPPGFPESPINHFNIPATCGKCHRAVESDYWEGIHGKLTLRGETDSPVCTDCHGEHGILRTDDPRSPVSPTRIAEATCSPCHESARLNEKYGIPTGRLQTFIDTYHGLKSKAGDVTVANCASCHGAHRILPHTDPTSSIYHDNLRETCGHCHPGISTAMATAPIHGTPGISQTPLAKIVRNIYIIAIFVIIGAMVLHWLLDLRKQIKLVTLEVQVRRMNYNELWQHTFLMITFAILVISGFSLRFSEAWWVKLLFGWEGGFPVRGIIHRVAAVLFIMTTIWHVVFLSTSRGRQFLRDIWPRKNDFVQFIEMILFNIGTKDTRPRFGRFSYVEKAEYWALVWGTVVMIITGLLLWFDNLAARWFPKGMLDVMLVIHYYEAWLATLAILIWHLYSTVFNPAVYPMNPSWLTGKMPQWMYRHEHQDLPEFHPEGHEERPPDTANRPGHRGKTL
jgi:cytochrome b subunit of formate dehydrogenase